MNQNEVSQNSGEDEEIKEIELLSDQLEQMYSQLEIIQKENNLLESYAQRNQIECPEKDCIQQGPQLTNEQKYQIALEEEKEINKRIENISQDHQEQKNLLQAQILEKQHFIKVLKKETQLLENLFLIPSTKDNQLQQPFAFLQFKEQKLFEKEQILSNLQIKLKQLEYRLKKEQSNQDLNQEDENFKYIDYHQLQIENKKLSKEFQEKNHQVQEYKRNYQKIKHKLESQKLTLKEQEQQIKDLDKEISEKLKEIKAIETEKNHLIGKINDIQKMNDQLTLQKNKMDDNKVMKMKVSNFIKNKEQEKQLHYDIKNLIRKNEIIDKEIVRKELN